MKFAGAPGIRDARHFRSNCPGEPLKVSWARVYGAIDGADGHKAGDDDASDDKFTFHGLLRGVCGLAALREEYELPRRELRGAETFRIRSRSRSTVAEVLCG